jgi:hypothetical protein
MPWYHIGLNESGSHLDVNLAVALEARFFVVGDFDADGLTEIVVAPYWRD